MVSAFDYLLSLILIFLTWQMLRAKDLFTSIVLFILLGMLISLAWVQLQAPDVALVEAVIGAALTGVLFLGSLGYIESGSGRSKPSIRSSFLSRQPRDYIFMILISVFGGGLCWTLFQLEQTTPGLSMNVAAELDRSGVKNPVTAVILNFRGYDTLLEIGVLLLVVFAIFALHATQPISLNRTLPKKSRVLAVFLYLLTPVMVLMSFYMLWAGGHAPGGAFQAGAMLAGVVILMLVGGTRIHLTAQSRLMRGIYVAGFAGFLLVGILVMNTQQNFLQYPVKLAKHLILSIEILATISIAATLVTLFAGCAGFLIPDDPEHCEFEVQKS